MGTNRILLGNRSTGGYGLYVSKTGDNVIDTTNPLAFDSRTGTGWSIKQAGQFATSGAQNIAHNLGYNPLFAIRYCTSSELSSNVATKVFTPSYVHATERDDTVPFEPEFTFDGFGAYVHFNGTNNIRVTTVGSTTLYYSYIVFNEPDFTGGKGL